MSQSQFKFDEKVMCDNVHGSIGISKLEQDIINTRTFQRLKKIKQLGLASLVFPSAEHSRFAHSIGAMYIMSRMVNRLKAEGYSHFTDNGWEKKKQKLRLAALLHDIGHYPLSHLGEQVFNWIDSEGAVPIASVETDPTTEPLLARAAIKHKRGAASHERLGEVLLTEDGSELKGIIENAGFDPNEIARIINAEHEENQFYTQLMSSTLDCDRMDFLLRDSIAAGTIYGQVDVNYILHNLTWDKNNELICYKPKAITAIEHFIMARFFSYNITYHKTILGFELMAKALLYSMMKDENFGKGEFGGIVRSFGDVKTKIKEYHTFIANFNDEYFWYYLEKWNPPRDTITSLARRKLLNRQPLRPILDERELHSDIRSFGGIPKYIEKNLLSEFMDSVQHQSRLDELKIDYDHVFVLARSIGFEGLTHTRKYDETIANDEDRLKLVKIKTDDGSEDLMSKPASILRVLSEYHTRIARVYALVDKDSDAEKYLRTTLRDLVHKHRLCGTGS